MLARFERLVEQAVEGSLRRVFPTTLHPVQLAKAAARAMEQGQVIGLRGVEVPNHYTVRLAPADLTRFDEYRGTLASQVSEYLVEYARERGMRPVADLHVEVREDEAIRPGQVRADARFADLAPAVRREVDEALEGTHRLRLADLAQARSAASAPTPQALRLTDANGLDFSLDRLAGIVRIGRATDNDVVIDSIRVSRYHAQLRWV